MKELTVNSYYTYVYNSTFLNNILTINKHVLFDFQSVPIIKQLEIYFHSTSGSDMLSLIFIFISDYWQSRSSWFTMHISRKILTMHFYFAVYCFILSAMLAFISDRWKYLSSCLSMLFLSWILKFVIYVDNDLKLLEFSCRRQFRLVLIPAWFSALWQRSNCFCFIFRFRVIELCTMNRK